ncbi:MAG TPA: sigma-70 family RNA polymerase sigma factor [Candidatus Udaeobacter sp.]|jgi:RNA polymerase sigma-70 factor (ECF subfamily)|nr:sigma-70 family RNA polymerase sigma factor [Candidatus Udaeobacter sp.]
MTTIDYRTQTDEELVRIAQAGDTRGFDELVVRYRDKVYRLSFKILRHEDDASEALQEAFLSAYKGLGKFKSESTFSTWLYRIATNAALMKYRRRRDGHVSLEQSQSSAEDAEPLQLQDWSALPVDDLLNDELRRVMQQGVDRLPEDLRTVFLLRDVEERSNAEVSQILDLSVAAVKSRLHRARLALRGHLNRYFAGRGMRRERA